MRPVSGRSLSHETFLDSAGTCDVSVTKGANEPPIGDEEGRRLEAVATGLGVRTGVPAFFFKPERRSDPNSCG
jgi:hypothetical protein